MHESHLSCVVEIGFEAAQQLLATEGASGSEVVDQPISLGIMVRRPPASGTTEARVDVPDLFRRPYDIKRKGGPLRIKSRD